MSTAAAPRGSRRAAASNVDLYQVNCTFFDALSQDEDAYLLARALQAFVPGIPQVYYVGLLAGHNDIELLHATGVGRDLNRRYYAHDEVTETLTRPVVARLLTLLRFRNTHPAFDGDDAVLTMGFEHGGEVASLTADLRARTLEVTFTRDGEQHTVTDLAQLPTG